MSAKYLQTEKSLLTTKNWASVKSLPTTNLSLASTKSLVINKCLMQSMDVVFPGPSD